MAKKTNPYLKMIKLFEKLYEDGGSTEETWHDIAHIHKLLNPEPEKEDRRRDLDEDIENDIPIPPDEFSDDIPSPQRYKIDHDAAEICIGGCDYENGSDAWVWSHFDEIEKAVYQIRRECKIPNFAVDLGSVLDDDPCSDPLSFLNGDNHGFSIPSDFDGAITIASTAKLEELQNEVKLLEASENLHLAKIRCLEKRITKPEKK